MKSFNLISPKKRKKKNKIKKVIPPINAEIKFDIFFDLKKYIIDKIEIKKII